MTNQLLRAARKRRGWTQEELAEQVGASTFSVIRWEQGTIPQHYYRTRLCALFALSEADLGMGRMPTEGECRPGVPQPEPARCWELPGLACPHLVGRQRDLALLCQKLREGQSLTLTGLPGVGKTSLALTMAREQSIRETFEGILWARLGRDPDLVSHCAHWGKLLGLPARQVAGLDSLASWREVLHRALGTRRYVLMLDDVWNIADLHSLSVGEACTSLVTSRSHRVAMESFHHVYTVRELDLAHSLQLLEQLVPVLCETEIELARQIARAAGGLPLALTIMAQYVLQQTYSGTSHRQRLRRAVHHLGHAEKRLHLGLISSSLQTSADLSQSLASQIQLSEHAVSEQARQALHALAVFPPTPSSFSEEAACAVARVPAETLEELVDSGLLERAGTLRYRLHPVIVDYAGLCQDASTMEELSTRLMTYVTEFLETHAGADYTLALESPMILAALEAAWIAGKQAELAHAIQLFAPFLWRIALPLTDALSQVSRTQELPGASQLTQAVVALAGHLRYPRDPGERGFPPLSRGATASLAHCPLPELQDSCAVLLPRCEQTGECLE